MLFEGSAVALVTPFDKRGEVNYFMFKKLIDFQISNGTKAIVILGTTGESPTISPSEREKIIKFCVCMVGKRIPVIVGCGSNSTETAVAQTLEAKRLGADAALVVTPYYNKCSADGLVSHFKTIASVSKFPIIAYNVPSRTGVNITVELAVRLSKIKHIVAIKEASGNMSQVISMIDAVPKNFAIYSGDDLLTLPIIACGGKGVISVTANCYPGQVSNLCDFMLRGDHVNAKRMHDYLVEINKALFLDVNPICVKHYLFLLGIDVGSPRLPLTQASQEVKNKLKLIRDRYEN